MNIYMCVYVYICDAAVAAVAVQPADASLYVVCMYVSIYVCLDVCMYEQVYVYVYI